MRKCLVVLLLFTFFSCNVLAAAPFIPKSDLIYVVLDKVRRIYVDQKRVQPEKMLKGSLERLSVMLPPVLTRLEEQDDEVVVHVKVDQYAKKRLYPSPRDLDDLNDILQDVAMFTKQHLEREEKPEKVDYALINGALTQLDPHTFLLVPEMYSSFNTEAQGNFGGVGMQIGIRDGKLTIIAPIDDTPTSRAGLKAKDRIMQIDGESTVNMSLTEAVKRIRGEVGTTVKLHIMRDGFSGPREYDIVRAIIKINTVESHVFASPQGRVGYLKIKAFQRNTVEEMNQHLEEMSYDLSDFKGLILDLRNNPGGFLDQAIGVSDRFLDDGVIVSTAGVRSSRVNSFEANWYGSLDKMPLIVLVNNGSASASEIVSAALKKNKRALVIGSTTFGKGSVQQVIPMRDGSALKITTSKYLTPGNISIQSVGVTPNIDIVPYYVSKDFLRVTAQKNEGTENSLDQNFSEWADQAEPSEKTIHHLYEEEEKDEEQVAQLEDLDSEETKVKRLQKDFVVQLSRKILQKNQKKNYRQLHRAAMSLLDREEALEKEKLVKKLAALENPIDWRSGPALKNPKLKVATWIELKKVVKKAGKEVEVWERIKGPVPGNSEVRIGVDVTNLGQKTLYRLMAKTDSENKILRNRQFAFGRLEPGKTRSWSVPVKVIEAAPSQSNLIKLQFQDIGEEDFYESPFVFEVQAKLRPSFEYGVSFYDDGQFGSKGNGDHIFQEGERIAVRATVKNQGQGTSGKVAVIFKNGEGKSVFLQKGRQTIDSLSPQGKSEVTFLFDVKRLPLDDVWDFSLDVIDSTFELQSVNHKIKIPVAEAVKTVQNHPPVIRLTAAPLQQGAEQYQLQGQLFDENGVKDCYIFANDKKIFYNNFVKKQNRQKVDFSVEVKLKEGMNRLIIISRDDHDVSARKSIFVRR